MVVTALVSIIVAVSATVFLTGLSAWVSGRDRTEIREGASLAMERMVRDLCQAGTITAATASAITFTADVNNDGVNETVTFNQNGIPDAQALTFSYTDLNNNSIPVPVAQASLSSIRVVTIALTMNKGDETYALSSSAYTRNQGP